MMVYDPRAARLLPLRGELPNGWTAIYSECVDLFQQAGGIPEAKGEMGAIGPTRHAEIAWAICAAGPPEPGMRVLDAGAGASPLPLYYARHGAEVHVLELPVEELARNLDYWDKSWGPHPEMAQRLGLDVNYAYGDIRGTIPLGTGTFDIVFCLSVLEHLTRSGVGQDKVIVSALQELARVTRPGGLVVITMDIWCGSAQRPSLLLGFDEGVRLAAEPLVIDDGARSDCESDEWLKIGTGYRGVVGCVWEKTRE